MPVAQSVATNNQLAIVANRFNYVFNLKGPADSSDLLGSLQFFQDFRKGSTRLCVSLRLLVLCSHVG